MSKIKFVQAVFIPENMFQLFRLTASAGFWLDGIFVVPTWGAAMRNTMLVSVVIFFILWGLTRGWDNHGLWLTMNGFMAARGLCMGWVLWRRLS